MNKAGLVYLMCSILFSVRCYNFNVNDVQLIVSSNRSNYFGYSVLLQKGNPPVVFVGAPKNDVTGSLFKCALSTKNCSLSTFNYIGVGKARYTKADTGSYFGATLVGNTSDGGSIFVCAPKFTIRYNSENIFQPGKCFVSSRSSNLTILPLGSYKYTLTANKSTFYNSAFGASGFSADMLNTGSFVIGAPGMLQWNGALVTYNMQHNEKDLLEPLTKPPQTQSILFGYSISSLPRAQNRSNVWYAVGAPRGHQLKGQVTIFQKPKPGPRRIDVVTELYGEQVGSYFGAAVLFVPGYGLLIGAPMSSGGTWDEGCVYFYHMYSNGSFDHPLKMRGDVGLWGARFGTSINVLGDIDLDTYSDVVISAPYESDGTGAVYIFMGINGGQFDPKYKQKIQPSLFGINMPDSRVRGFGFGLSPGCDVDGNEHNDLAVGAYGSGQVFVLRARPIIDIQVWVNASHTNLYLSTTELLLGFCASFRRRSKSNAIKNDSLPVRGECKATLDDRILNAKRHITWTHEQLSSDDDFIFCANKTTIHLKLSMFDLRPFSLTWSCAMAPLPPPPHKAGGGSFMMSPQSNHNITHIIPIDNGCEYSSCLIDGFTRITIHSSLTEVILGSNSQVEFHVTITNIRNTAIFLSELRVAIPQKTAIINMRECYRGNTSVLTICPIDEVLISKRNRSFQINLERLDATDREMWFYVTFVGHDGSSNGKNMSLPLTIVTNPFMESVSEPTNLMLTSNALPSDYVTIFHKYLLGNLGPSSLHFNMSLLIPRRTANSFSIFLGATKLRPFCPWFIDQQLHIHAKTTKKLEYLNLNRTIILGEIPSSGRTEMGVTEDVKFPNLVICQCPIVIEPHASGVLELVVVFNLSLSFVRQLYEEFSYERNSLALISVGRFSNETEIFREMCVTMIFGLENFRFVPMWIILCSLAATIIVVLFLVFILYKMNFFKRKYKKMPRELINDTTTNTKSDNFAYNRAASDDFY